jgi:biopolymer transport protein ExbB
VLYRHLFVLGLVAAVSPLLGLLGTVLGMIYSFGALYADVGDVDLRVVADGISIALLTTFAGLVIAVPSIVAHRYLMNRADQYTRELRRYGVSLVRFIKSHELRLATYEDEGQNTDDASYSQDAEDLMRA